MLIYCWWYSTSPRFVMQNIYHNPRALDLSLLPQHRRLDSLWSGHREREKEQVFVVVWIDLGFANGC